jgi:hypothetical protein
MLAGGKRENLNAGFVPKLRDTNPETRNYQGMIFLIPFFFLLVDSVLESALSPLTGA